MLLQRRLLAQLCGYETFSERAMSESLGATPQRVDAFLTHLSAGLKDSLKDDFGTMLNMKRRSNPLAKELHIWDVPHFSMMAKAKCTDLDPEKVAPYFSLGVCMDGLNTIFQSIFNVSALKHWELYCRFSNQLLTTLSGVTDC